MSRKSLAVGTGAMAFRPLVDILTKYVDRSKQVLGFAKLSAIGLSGPAHFWQQLATIDTLFSVLRMLVTLSAILRSAD